MTEILEELPRLGHSERQAILRRLIQLDAGIDIEESPEMLAAIDAGVSSLEKTGSPVCPWSKLASVSPDGLQCNSIDARS